MYNFVNNFVYEFVYKPIVNIIAIMYINIGQHTESEVNMYRINVLYTNLEFISYDISSDDLDDEIEKLCLDDNVLNFTYRKLG